MHYRTSHWLMMLRVFRVSWGVVLIFLLMLGLPIALPMLIVAATVFGMMLAIGAVVKFLGWMEFGDDPDYQRARASGWHPYFDLLPPGINNDSLAVRVGGIPEPQTDFVPPDDWLRQCQRCGARNQSCSPGCWHCKTTFVPNAVAELRTFNCSSCGKSLTELVPGTLETGVSCCYCGAITCNQEK